MFATETVETEVCVCVVCYSSVREDIKMQNIDFKS